ncbi:hypothetical protein EZV62_015904 [Acer yangbiense]|uniref:Uncharacterized protein n=1 Tax=Acer yangbiense TaxID=1000413 RepID=A0A5C7HMY0_9ROSI|nr:hypothetical protein EZV62_015904 [Acer yangbiense]
MDFDADYMLTDRRKGKENPDESKPAKSWRYIPQSSEKTLDAPNIQDNFYLDLLDWGCSNVLAITLVTVTSVSWDPDGRHIAVGLNNSHVQIWDSTSIQKNENILTTGGMDGKIINNGVRVREHIVQTYKGHHQDVCGLKWSASGQKLASGGNDNLVFI